ncbi:NUDIX domain-containing protein [Maridesulfovibrio sp.]|uniref:NUDIX hydrolase n=1 Tax=Maridesulfovibrio sp. TaxID=2795000 RepID=UPI002A18B15F|nr:NUDIX domain-containing protein [Maridesulfovibrio sp.]
MYKTNTDSKKAKKQISLIEVVDSSDLPLTSMEIKEVHRQSLPHRSVIVLVYDADEKLYLQKRSASKRLYAGRWDVSAAGHVYAGEARFDAALRELKNELGITTGGLRKLKTINASAETGYEFISIYILEKTTAAPVPNPDEVESGYFYSKDELEWLIGEYRELLTPALVFLHDQGLLYSFR